MRNILLLLLGVLYTVNGQTNWAYNNTSVNPFSESYVTYVVTGEDNVKVITGSPLKSNFS